MPEESSIETGLQFMPGARAALDITLSGFTFITLKHC